MSSGQATVGLEHTMGSGQAEGGGQAEGHVRNHCMLRVLVAEEDEALGLHAAGRINNVGTFSPTTGEAAFDQSVYEDLNSCRNPRTQSAH